MLMSILMNLICSLSISLTMLSHPLSMGLILLLQTLSIALLTGLINQTFWYSYIMFLIMVGGMMVIFIYMTSIASNEKFKFSKTILLIWLMSSLLTILFILTKIQLIFNQFNQDSTISNQILNTEMSMTKFINQPSNLLMLTIIIYLLITMIAVVKISNTKMGSLRKMN